MGAHPRVDSNVADFADKLPKAVISKGGVCMYVIHCLCRIRTYDRVWDQVMYQREALWVSFSAAPLSRAAVKVSVGGVNASTGQAQGKAGEPGEQDYLPVNRVNGQLYVSS